MLETDMSLPPVFQRLEYFLWKKRGFVFSSIEVQTPDGLTVGVWMKPRRLVRGFLAVILAPAAFLGTMILGFWLFGAFAQDPQGHSANQDPSFWGSVLGVLYAGMVIASPFVVMNWIYPANYLVLKDFRASRMRRLEVRSRMALTLKTVRYTVLGSTGEKLAVVHRDIFGNRYRVFPADGGPFLWLSADDPRDELGALGVWMLASGLVMILAAITFGAVAIPGALSGSKGAFGLWIQDERKATPARRIGQASSRKGSDSQVHLCVDDEAALDGSDRRLLLGLAAVLWLS